MYRLAVLLFFVAMSAWPQNTESELFAEAESRYLGKSYAAALDSYGEFLSRFPLSDLAPDVQYRRAVCFYRLRKYPEAYRLLQEIERKYRTTRYRDYLPFWEGLCLYQQKEYALSVEKLDAFMTKTKDPELAPQTLLYRSLSLVELGEEPRAKESLSALAKDHRGADVFPYAAVLLASLLQREKAFTELNEFTSSVDPSGFPQPEKGRFLLARAEGLWETGRRDEAIGIYRGLLDGVDDVALTAYRRLFSAAEKNGDLEQMKALTRAAETRFSGAPGALSDLWTRAGAESFRAGDFRAAELFLSKAWESRAASAPAEAVPLYLAEIYLLRKDAAGARSILEEYVSGNGTGAADSAIMRLGDIALQTGDLAGARKWYSRFMENFPKSPRSSEAGYLLAYVAYRQGNLEESSAITARCLQDTASGKYRRELLRLRIVLLKKKGDLQGAAVSLSDYISQYPDDIRARVDLLKVLFIRKEYPRMVKEAEGLWARFPSLKTQDPYAYLLSTYLHGLGLIAAKDYLAAVRDLEVIRKEEADKAGLGSITAYAGYYLGWAHLKNGGLDRAAALFDSLASAYPSHELAPKLLFMAGWSRFSLGQFDRSASLFSRAARGGGTPELTQKSLYLSAKSLFNAKKLAEASSAFQSILKSSPPSPFADSAMFDYAGVLSEQGSVLKAAETYRSLAEEFPDSSLVEEAAYRRAETYYTHGRFAEARAAFSDYRTRFPKGKFVDAALYWGGEAAVGAKEKFGAVLLWEELIGDFRESSFRAVALQKSAEIYVEARDLKNALRLYAQLIAEHPAEARAARADIIAEQLHYQILGLGERESELKAAISREEGGKKTESVLELARLYVSSGEKKKAEEGYRMLSDIAVKERDDLLAARAQFLSGEYFYRKGDLQESGKRFLAAAAKGASDADFAASAIFRAAEMMKLAGRRDEVKSLVGRLESNFPASPWTKKARALMEADG